uniref:Uncharacterized protein n=1 Tax=uncultured prokaryote TaxID=198431 RepID=A0A0H5Q4K9_9ZZZZ|nr:hypothetical protein [uncultured prokaryote]
MLHWGENYDEEEVKRHLFMTGDTSLSTPKSLTEGGSRFYRDTKSGGSARQTVLVEYSNNTGETKEISQYLACMWAWDAAPPFSAPITTRQRPL